MQQIEEPSRTLKDMKDPSITPKNPENQVKNFFPEKLNTKLLTASGQYEENQNSFTLTVSGERFFTASLRAHCIIQMIQTEKSSGLQTAGDHSEEKTHDKLERKTKLKQNIFILIIFPLTPAKRSFLLLEDL